MSNSGEYYRALLQAQDTTEVPHINPEGYPVGATVQVGFGGSFKWGKVIEPTLRPSDLHKVRGMIAVDLSGVEHWFYPSSIEVV